MRVGRVHIKERRELGVEPVEDFQQFGVLWHTTLQVADDSVPVYDEDGALDALAVGLDGIVGIGN